MEIPRTSKSADRKSKNYDEVLARLRRIETRQVQHMIASGIDTQSQRPQFRISPEGAAVVTLPSMHSSVKEMLDSIPATCEGRIDVFVGDDHVATIRKGRM